MTHHDLTLNYKARTIRRGLNMPAGKAHEYAVALCGEFMVGAYTLNEAEISSPIMDSEIRRLEQGRYLTDDDTECEGLD